MILQNKDTFWATPAKWATLITSENIPSGKQYVERPVKLVDGVAVVDVSGVLLREEDDRCEYFGGASTIRISRQLAEAVLNPDVKSILLHVNSPGGQVNGTAELADQIYAARAVKPVTAFIAGDGYSAAYWLASQADKVFMHEAAGAGAIGVCYPVENENYGEWLISNVSPNKYPEVAKSESKAQMQIMLDDLGALFVAAVGRGRGVDSGVVVSKFGGGDIFIAAKAVERGLADVVGAFETALAFAKGATLAPVADAEGEQPLPAAPAAPAAPDAVTAEPEAIIEINNMEKKMANEKKTPTAEMVDSTEINADWLKTNLPELYDQIVTEAQDAETTRQTEIDAMEPANDEEKAAVTAARADRKVTAQKLAFDLRLKAQAREKAKIEAITKQRAEDSAQVIVPSAPAAVAAVKTQDEKLRAIMEAKAAAFKGKK